MRHTDFNAIHDRAISFRLSYIEFLGPLEMATESLEYTNNVLQPKRCNPDSTHQCNSQALYATNNDESTPPSHNVKANTLAK